mmetsp:Transcript_72870/g.187913  ORF Transcript_72870/g.187913 Transcript_72870/m.187913 type:complete len:454 (-) Transcript_72870:392-1753(-)
MSGCDCVSAAGQSPPKHPRCTGRTAARRCGAGSAHSQFAQVPVVDAEAAEDPLGQLVLLLPLEDDVQRHAEVLRRAREQLHQSPPGRGGDAVDGHLDMVLPLEVLQRQLLAHHAGPVWHALLHEPRALQHLRQHLDTVVALGIGHVEKPVEEHALRALQPARVLGHRPDAGELDGHQAEVHDEHEPIVAVGPHLRDLALRALSVVHEVLEGLVEVDGHELHHRRLAVDLALVREVVRAAHARLPGVRLVPAVLLAFVLAAGELLQVLAGVLVLQVRGVAAAATHRARLLFLVIIRGLGVDRSSQEHAGGARHRTHRHVVLGAGAHAQEVLCVRPLQEVRAPTGEVGERLLLRPALLRVAEPAAAGLAVPHLLRRHDGREDDGAPLVRLAALHEAVVPLLEPRPVDRAERVVDARRLEQLDEDAQAQDCRPLHAPGGALLHALRVGSKRQDDVV